MQKILGHRSILTTARYIHMTYQTGTNSRTLINALINDVARACGGAR